MKRRFPYIFVALLTFGFGSFLVSQLVYQEKPKMEAQKLKETPPKITIDFKYESLKPIEPADKKELKKSVCKDERIQAVWNHVIKNQGEIDIKTGNCVELFEIKAVDLNIDGQKEFLIRGHNPSLCGGTGNCSFWIVQKSKGKYRIILSSNDYVDQNKMGKQILKTKTNGYPDILLKGHISAPDTSYRFYKFNGKKYQLNKDLVNACTVCVGDNPKWKFITREEYQKKNH